MSQTSGKWIYAKFHGRCENFAECGKKILPGDKVYFRGGHTWCAECGEIQEGEEA